MSPTTMTAAAPDAIAGAVPVEPVLAEPVLADEGEQVTELISQDLLVEEVSIDGMCGVY